MDTAVSSMVKGNPRLGLTGATLGFFVGFGAVALFGPTAVRFREAMERLAETSRHAYRSLVHEDPRLFELFLDATPVRELTHVHYGSRPAYRERAVAGRRDDAWSIEALDLGEPPLERLVRVEDRRAARLAANEPECACGVRARERHGVAARRLEWKRGER